MCIGGLCSDVRSTQPVKIGSTENVIDVIHSFIMKIIHLVHYMTRKFYDSISKEQSKLVHFHTVTTDVICSEQRTLLNILHIPDYIENVYHQWYMMLFVVNNELLYFVNILHAMFRLLFFSFYSHVFIYYIKLRSWRLSSYHILLLVYFFLCNQILYSNIIFQGAYLTVSCFVH